MMTGIGWSGGGVVTGVAGWVLTYAVHSTILLGGAVLAAGRLVRADAWRETVWKAALLGGLVTASLHTAVGYRPLTGEWRVPPGSFVGWLADGAGLAARIGALAPGGAEAAGRRATRSPADFAAGRTGGRAAAEGERAEAQEAGPAALGASRRPTAASPLWPIALVVAWGVGGLLFLARLVHRHVRLLRLLRDRRPVPDERVLSLLAALRRNAGVWRPVRLTASAACPGPLALGNSEICVPDRFLRDLDPEQQRNALAHELGHLARRDPAWHLTACLLEAIFFFQPLNRVARRRLRDAAENLCDDWAVRQTGSPLGLARCLAEVASWVGRGAERVPSGTMAMADGGSPLVRRVERLLSQRSASPPRGLRLRPMAAAGLVFLVSAAAPTVSVDGPRGTEAERGDGEVAAAAAGEADAPVARPRRGTGRDDLAAQPPPAAAEPAVARKRAAARPEAGQEEAVIRHPEPGAPLEERWRWAEVEAGGRGHSEYWIAYAFERVLPPDEVLVEDSRGWSKAKRDDVPLGTLVFGPSYAPPPPEAGPVPRPVLVLFHVDGSAAGAPRVDRVSVRTASAGMGLRGDPLYWLGAAPGAESFEWLRRRVDGLGDRRLQATAIEALALHEDTERVVPYLEQIVRSDRPSRTRLGAVEGLAWHPTERAVALLRTAALEDRSEDVGEEAAETLGELGTPEASAALGEIIRTSRRGDVRREAVEALGEADPAAAAEVLEELLRSDAPPRRRREAVRALASRPSPEVLEAIARAALSDPDRRLREEAVEALAEFGSPDALPYLERIIWEHPATDARHEAVQGLGALPPELALPVLDEVVARHPDAPVVREAVETIAEFPSDLSVPRLLRVLREDPRADVRREALDRLGRLAEG